MFRSSLFLFAMFTFLGKCYQSLNNVREVFFKLLRRANSFTYREARLYFTFDQVYSHFKKSFYLCNQIITFHDCVFVQARENISQTVRCFQGKGKVTPLFVLLQELLMDQSFKLDILFCLCILSDIVRASTINDSSVQQNYHVTSWTRLAFLTS